MEGKNNNVLVPSRQYRTGVTSLVGVAVKIFVTATPTNEVTPTRTSDERSRAGQNAIRA